MNAWAVRAPERAWGDVWGPGWEVVDELVADGEASEGDGPIVQMGDALEEGDLIEKCPDRFTTCPHADVRFQGSLCHVRSYFRVVDLGALTDWQRGVDVPSALSEARDPFGVLGVQTT
jgi:hypothetical protein